MSKKQEVSMQNYLDFNRLIHISAVILAFGTTS